MTLSISLNPNGSLRYTEIPGRCGRYWELFLCRQDLHERLLDAQDHTARTKLSAMLSDAHMQAQAHMEVCKPCRAWLAAIEEAPHAPHDCSDQPVSAAGPGRGSRERVQLEPVAGGD